MNKPVTVPEVISAAEVKEHKTTVEVLKEKMSAIKVTSQEELTAVAVHIADVRKKKQVFTEARDKYITPAKQIIDLAKQNFDPFINLCIEIEKELKSKGEAFMALEAKRVADSQAKELAKVDSGYQKEDTAVEKISKIAPPVKKVSVGGATFSQKIEKEVVIVDEKLIPDEYYKPRELDMVKIKKVATAGVVIPGVRVDTKTSSQFRGPRS